MKWEKPEMRELVSRRLLEVPQKRPHMWGSTAQRLPPALSGALRPEDSPLYSGKETVRGPDRILAQGWVSLVGLP